MTLRKLIFSAAVVALWLLVVAANRTDKDTLPPATNSSSANEPAIILSGVNPLEIVPITYPEDLDFGKGKLALFDFFVPADEDFRIERMDVHLEGVSSDEVPELWLRFNSVRVYTKTEVRGSNAEIIAFPPVLPAQTAPPVDTQGTPSQILRNTQETQQLLHVGGSLSQTLQRNSGVSIGIYGKWAEGIAPRTPENGIRLCVDEISGSLSSGAKAKTQLASPLCFPKMGVGPAMANPQNEIVHSTRPSAVVLGDQGNAMFTLEIADTPQARAQGLADRDSLPQTQGMLFLWDDNPGAVTFTMAGMRFPLDIIFIDSSQKIIHIARSLPACPMRQGCRLAAPPTDAQYVLEINAGLAAQYDITTGDLVSFAL